MPFPPPLTASARFTAALAVIVSVLAMPVPAVSVPAVGAPLAATTATAAEGAAWRWPLSGPRMLLRPYVAPATPYSAGHRGIDIGTTSTAAEIPVYAPAAGIVHYSGVVVDRPVLSIRHSGGVISSFEAVSTELVAGSPVTAGQEVGRVQAGGHCRAPCLHFGIRLNGDYLSPLNFLGGVPHSVLLPTRAISPPGRSAPGARA